MSRYNTDSETRCKRPNCEPLISERHSLTKAVQASAHSARVVQCSAVVGEGADATNQYAQCSIKVKRTQSIKKRNLIELSFARSPIVTIIIDRPLIAH